jgi:preprotein translocase subunit SecD
VRHERPQLKRSVRQELSLKINTVILCAVFAAVVTTNLFAADYVEYDLSKDKIHMARVVEASKKHYAVEINLNDSEKEIFSRITAENVENRLAITYKGNVLIKPIVREKIPSGIIVVGDWEMREEAEEFVHRLLSE